MRRITGTAIYAAAAMLLLALATAADASSHPRKPAKPDGIVVVDRKAASAGGSVTVLKTPDFKVTGDCIDNGGGDVTADTFLIPRRNNLAYSAYAPGGLDDEFDTDFDKSESLDITSYDATGTAPAIEAAEYYEFYAEGKGGRPMRGRIETTVHSMGDDCGFSGVFTGTPGSGPVHVAKRIKLDAGESAKVYGNSDFKVIGSCVDNGAGDLTASASLVAKRSGAMYYLTQYNVYDTDFNPADGPVDITPTANEAHGADPEFQAWSYYNDFFAVDRNGRPFQGRIGSGVHVRGADCTFSGVFSGPGSSRDLELLKLVKVPAGESRTVFRDKNFLVTGECLDNGGGDVTAQSSLDARREHLMQYAYDGDPYFDTDFGPGDGSVDIMTADDATGTAPQLKSVDQYTDFYGEGRGGEVLAGRIATAVHVHGADCAFSGYFAG
ncbi:MAG: hypothetical protein U0R51_01695 [Solirubrobacterales bacterium]